MELLGIKVTLKLQNVMSPVNVMNLLDAEKYCTSRSPALVCSPTQTFLPSLYTSFFPADIASLESKIHFELISRAYSNQ